MKDMEQITIPETTITDEQYAYNARQLVAAITLQATRDYCQSVSSKNRAIILKELRSSRMDNLSNGMSTIVAEQLELHPEEIRERMRRNNDEDML